MKYWITSVLLALLALPAAAQGEIDRPPQNYVEEVTNAGTSAAAFLQIGVGARAQAMGNAATADGRDATSMYWNPASIANLDGMVNVAFDHTSWLADTQLDYLGAVFNFGGIGSLGISIVNFQMIDQQPVRTIDLPEGTGEFYSASNLALSATYAMALTNRFSAGITGKYVRESLWNESASAIAVDFGITYRTTLPGLFLAASITNFGSDMKLDGRDLMRPYDDDPENYSNDQLNVRLDTDKFSLPLHFRFGLAYVVAPSDMHRFTLAADLLHPSDNSEAINLGVEYLFWDTIAFRGGYASLFERDRTGGATLGVGVQRKLIGGIGLAADYTYADWGLLENTHRITIAISQ